MKYWKNDKNLYFKNFLRNIFYKIILCLILLKPNYLISDDDIESFNYDIKGKVERQETINFLSGSKFISFMHEGGFDTSIGKYGLYKCTGSIFYNKENVLEDMTYACEFKDQNSERFYSTGKRLKGSEIDRSVGRMKIIEGEGFWNKYSGFDCRYGLEYVENIVFVNANCNKPN